MNWKKIAEAFGRAVYGKGDDNEVAKAARNAFKRDLDNYDKDPTASARAEAFFEGRELAGMDDAIVRREVGTDKWRADREGVEQRMDELNNERTDKYLEEDFDKGFESALAKRRGKIRDAMGDARDTEEAADAGIDDIRKAAIEMLKSGKDIGDVLRILKGE